MKKLLLLAFLPLLLTACASDDTSTTRDERVSTIPWNKPQNWEHSGPAGGLGGLGGPGGGM